MILFNSYKFGDFFQKMFLLAVYTPIDTLTCLALFVYWLPSAHALLQTLFYLSYLLFLVIRRRQLGDWNKKIKFLNNLRIKTTKEHP